MKRASYRSSTDVVTKTINYIPQFDLSTGEVLSPAFSQEEFPRLLRSPQSKTIFSFFSHNFHLHISGVNVNVCPYSFGYSYPHDGVHVRRAVYYDAAISENSPAPSGIEIFTNVS